MASSNVLVVTLMLSQLALLATSTQATLNSTASATEAAPEDSIFDSTNGLGLGGSILAVVAVLLGGGMVTFGYRFLYETLFVIGFALGAVCIAVTTEGMLADKSYMALGSWIAFILGGALCGGLVMWAHPKSSFIAGVSGGMTLAVLVANSAACYVFPGKTTEFFTILCVVFSAVFAAFDLKHGKPVEVVAISLFGAASLVWGVGFFVGDFPFPNNLEKYAVKNANGKLVYTLPTVWWAYLGSIVVIAVLGAFLQFRKTGRNVAHAGINDEFEGFEPNGFGYPIDAVPFIENDKQRPTIPVLGQSQTAPTTRESDASSSYPANETFCMLYSRNTEAQSLTKMRSKFLEAREQSLATKSPLDLRPSVQPSSSMTVTSQIQEEEL
ncbi:Transmembrane protein [Phytophthora cinnamomi]|uniref:Transmembrane protein n=1 Tax=Phytophthora cinnamomi TaxID=4785 RepID=UPI003559E767|nr:Transmembrane protein [Phytophthora cinnamomi]